MHFLTNKLIYILDDKNIGKFSFWADYAFKYDKIFKLNTHFFYGDISNM